MQTSTATQSLSFSPYQKLVIALMAFLQFTIILDFMIISPLGAMLMPALNISTHQFGLVVSAYAFSAGISGILASGFADRYDRKKLLIFFYSGFVFATLLCGLAQSYQFLLFARILTGIFGGVIGSIILAITTDLFPFQMRGRVMGLLQTAFSASQILGIPLGLYLSNLWDWHAPFMMIVAASLVAGVIIIIYMKPVDQHLLNRVDRKAFHHFWMTISNRKYFPAFATTALLSTGGFMLMPFGSAFTVGNLGIDIARLPMIYLITGICALIFGPLIGKATDQFGKFKVFLFGGVLSIVMVIFYTNMGISPLWLVILVNAIMFVGIFSRMIPAQAMMSAIPEPENRGSFMAVSSSLQQISGGLASVIAGSIVISGANGQLEHFDTLGYILVFTTLITMVLMYSISKSIKVTAN
ncbi:MAG: MFS transporter [Bdellovibrionota bacterium]